MNVIKKITIACLLLGLTSGCFKRDTMDDINIYTTVYPIEYLITNIYGYNSNIDSIYPDGVSIKDYNLTDKQISEYSQTDMFIYNGLSKEKQVAAAFLEDNKNIKVIDVSKGLSYQNDVEELWLCPSNYLMLAQNIKNELLEYTSSSVLKDEINDKYSDLKLTISKYDAELKLIAEKASNKTLVVGNDVFLFLEKYGFKVINVEENEKYTSNDYQDAKNLITSKSVNYIFILDTDEENENTKSLKDAGAKVIKIKSMMNRSEEESAQDIDYTNMMLDFIEQIKMEVNN